MAQIARPESDISKGSWNPFPATPTTLFDKINEITPNGDTNYAYSDVNEDECEVGLTAVLDPNIRTGFKIRCHANSPSGSGPKEQITVSLVENGMVIASSPATDVSRTGYGLVEYTLSETEANLIQNYSNLRLRFHVTKVSGGESIRVTQAEFEVPDVIEMTQFARPDGDITVGSWSPYPADPTTLFDKINEVTPDDDASYIVSSTDEDECEVSLGAVNDPEVGTGHKIRVWARVLNGGGAAEQITISLVENGNVRCEDGPHNVSRGAYALIEYTLLEAEANAITNYANLRLRVHINKTDPDEPIRITQAEFECPDAPAGYSITCDPGAYGLAGVATGLKHDHKIIAAPANYGLGGQSASLLKDRLILIGVGTYALTGQDVVVTRVFTLPADAGSYGVTGQIVNLIKDSKLSIGAGAYGLTGQIASLLKDSNLIIGVENYGLTGSEADLNYIVGYTLNAEAGTYALAGQIVNLKYNRIMDAEAGSYALAGQAVGFYYDRKIIPGLGAFALSGSDVTLIYGVGYTLTAEPGSYALSGQIATLLKDNKIIISPADYALGGQDVGLLKDNVLRASSGAYSLSGYLANLVREAKIIAESGSFTISGQPITLLHAMKLLIGPGAYALSGKDVDLIFVPGILYSERLMDGYLEKEIGLSGLLEKALDISGKTEEALDIRAILKKTLKEE